MTTMPMPTSYADIFTPNQIYNFGQLAGSPGGGLVPANMSGELPINASNIASFNLPSVAGAGGGGLFGGGGALGTGMSGLQLGSLGLQGLSTIGGLISSFGALNLAKKQFRLQKDVLNTNLNNQIKAYNTALDDKARSRAVVEGQTDQERDAYIEANKATR